MIIPDIDFARVRSLGAGGQRDGYGQQICELVAQESPDADAKFMSLHGAGGDGGVECYWTLPDGTEQGWQAKYWTSHADVDKSQLDTSVKAALTNHPDLTKYTIAIPADPTGRTGDHGKSLLEKINNPGGWLDGWQTMAAGRGMTVTFEFEWATNIATRLARVDATGAQRRYWFDADVLSQQWWIYHLHEATDAAGPRYTPELDVDVPAARSIAALVLTMSGGRSSSTKATNSRKRHDACSTPGTAQRPPIWTPPAARLRPPSTPSRPGSKLGPTLNSEASTRR